MINLKSSEIKELRDEILKKQEYKCALCFSDIRNADGVSLDHQHKRRKSDENGVDGSGLIRGVLCRSCNVLEGKIWNNMTRFNNPETVSDRIVFLESLISYYKKENYNYVHPNEVKKENNTLKKSFYNRIKKEFIKNFPKLKVPEYPKSGTLTKDIINMLEKLNKIGIEVK